MKEGAEKIIGWAIIWKSLYARKEMGNDVLADVVVSVMTGRRPQTARFIKENSIDEEDEKRCSICIHLHVHYLIQQPSSTPTESTW